MKKNYPKSNIGKKLLKYGAFAGALAGVSEASGQIVYTDINPDFAGGNDMNYMLDLDGDGTDDFNIYQVHNSSSWYGFSYSYNYLYMMPMAATNEILGDSGYYAYPFALDAGDIISSGQTSWNNNSFSYGYMSLNYAGYDGNFIGVTDKYVGVRFAISGAIHYGWVRLDVDASGSSWVVKDFAYNVTPGAAIEAGQTVLATDDTDLANTIKVVAMNKTVSLFNLPESSDYKVYNTAGQVIMNGSYSNTDVATIELGGVSNGVYIVEITDVASKAVFRKKVML
ncbi:T9SS type A sorting domain-containing protein [Neptunitalea lumnitzerae]|uniref:Secretion system C-terminal sorting domain-containing protein n=1 Tax=Neptunitalea lumnitzerae TaxID=2965509 RepID=A0ABQ5MMW5_9FLAO|nr:T9SS type A sorting domain-containing protein [Neptunitalea sp. Y10]GLB50450.1 hypothetical protein Y10_28180 [Neptunitalea sp. Y10]